MDVVHDDTTGINEEEKEDRISNLPDDIVHRILSFLDMKHAIQTSTLSKKWKHVWTSMSHLNLSNQTFGTFPQFSKFVRKALSRRNHHTEVSAVKLSFTGTAYNFAPVVKRIVKYAYVHNVRHVTMMWFSPGRIYHGFPECIFSSPTLKHLTLVMNERSRYPGSIPKLAWDFPALETLSLSNLRLGDYACKSVDLFSKCVNLKDLTLHQSSMSCVELINVCAPQLRNLTITDPYHFPKVFNVVAPQLKNLTASVSTRLNFHGFNFLQLSTEGLNSLEKTLSLGLDQLLREPCPFNSLKCLKIDTLKQKDCIAEVSAEVRDYFLESSSSAAFIVDIPQVPQKRSRQEAAIDTMAKKVAKLEEEKQTMVEEKITLEAKIKMQDEVIAEHKVLLEVMKLQQKKSL
ncbi:hypothetical protein OSB04_019793 [Centaurea solstitialis]|uniref:F-box domain-containing protein n=1 Tax=Centaurea solstitialis TaxID=347529 RepID=A0AA38WCP8_9ASTR|nr:hypothetical protein OSB04_019793 [Centaurea solstitialis]